MKLMESSQHLTNGVILEAPFLGIPDFVPSAVVSAGVFLGRYRLTRWIAVSKVESSLISHDKELVKSYDTDPLVFHGGVPAASVTASMDAKDEVFKNAGALQVALLIAHGDDDRICPISGSKRLYEAAGSADKTLKTYEQAYHVLRGEPQNKTKEKFLKDVIDWIQSRC